MLTDKNIGYFIVYMGDTPILLSLAKTKEESIQRYLGNYYDQLPDGYRCLEVEIKCIDS